MDGNASHLDKRILQIAREGGHELGDVAVVGVVQFALYCRECGVMLAHWHESYSGGSTLLMNVVYTGYCSEQCSGDDIPF